MISTLLNLLSFVLRPSTLSILKSVPYALEETLYSALDGRVFYRRLFDLVGLSVVQVFCFLVFCFLVLSIVEREVLKPPTTIVELFIFPSDSVVVSFMFFHAGKQ